MTKVVGQRIRLRLWLQDVECPIISCHVSNNIRSAAQVRVLYTAALRKVLPGTRVLVGFLHTDGSYRVLFLGHLHAVKFQDAASSKEATLECAMDFALLERFPAYAWTINETVFQKIRQFSGATTLFSSVTDSQFTALLQQYFSPQRVVNTPGAPFSGPARGVIAIVEAAMGLAPVAQKPPAAPPAATPTATPTAATGAETQTPSANEYFAVMGAQSQILRQIVGLGLDIKTDKLFRALVSTHLLDAAVQQMSGVQSIGDILQTVMFNLCHVIYTVPTAGYRTVSQQTQEYDAAIDLFYPVDFSGSWADLLTPFFSEDMTFIEKGGVKADDLADQINAVRALCAQAAPVATNGTLSRKAWSDAVGEKVSDYYADNGCVEELVFAVHDAVIAAVGKIEAQDQVVTTLVLPNLYFARPPACNVIGPDQISSLDYAVPYMDRPTRAILFARPIPDRGTPQQSNNLLTLAAFSPKAAATDSSDNLQFNLLDHERVTGVVMRQFDITAIQALLKTDGGEGETALTAQEERQRLADYRFIEERYKDTTLSVSGPFNPHLCPGLPCIVYDDGKRGGRPKETYHGFIQSIQHSITESSAATMYTLTHVHTASENIASTILRPNEEAEGNFIKALHDAVSPRWLDNSYAYDNIGESVYRPLLGCGAADPNRLAISLRERNLANVDAVLSPSATYKVAACAITRECPTGTAPTAQPGSTPVADAAVKVLEQRREAAEAYANSAKPRGFGDAQ